MTGDCGAVGVAVQHTEVVAHAQADAVDQVKAHTAADHHVPTAIAAGRIVVEHGVDLIVEDTGRILGLGGQTVRDRRAAEEEEAEVGKDLGTVLEAERYVDVVFLRLGTGVDQAAEGGTTGVGSLIYLRLYDEQFHLLPIFGLNVLP